MTSYFILTTLAALLALVLSRWVRRPGLKAHAPVIEIMVSVFTWVVLFNVLGWGVLLIRYALASTLLIVAAVFDWRHGIIPDRLMVFGAVAGGGLLLAEYSEVLFYLSAAGIAGGGLGLLHYGTTYFLRRPGLGLGDVKLAFVLGLMIGWPALWAIYLAAVAGSVVGLVGIVLGRFSRQTHLPFAPLILLGAALGATVLPLTLFWPI